MPAKPQVKICRRVEAAMSSRSSSFLPSLRRVRFPQPISVCGAFEAAKGPLKGNCHSERRFKATFVGEAAYKAVGPNDGIHPYLPSSSYISCRCSNRERAAIRLHPSFGGRKEEEVMATTLQSGTHDHDFMTRPLSSRCIACAGDDAVDTRRQQQERILNLFPLNSSLPPAFGTI